MEKTFPQSDASKFFMAKLAPRYEKCRVLCKHSPLVYELESVVTGKNLGFGTFNTLKVIKLFLCIDLCFYSAVDAGRAVRCCFTSHCTARVSALSSFFSRSVSSCFNKALDW